MTVITHIEKDDPRDENYCPDWQIHLSRPLTKEEWKQVTVIANEPGEYRQWITPELFANWHLGYSEEYANGKLDRVWMDGYERYQDDLVAYLETLN